MAIPWLTLGIVCFGFGGLVFTGIGLFYIGSIYNGLIGLRNNTDKAWANIDVLLKQRYDLIPNLVRTVKEYTKYEKGVLVEITKLRSATINGSPTERAGASNRITEALKSIFAVAEDYLKLRASENFLELQKQLSAIENQITDRREFYNNSVLLYNTRIHAIPDTVLAMVLSMKKREYFKATSDEKKEVEIEV